MKITLAPLEQGDLPQVAHLHVAPEQEVYVGTVAEAFADQGPHIDLHAIMADGVVVGFFKIDRDYRKTIPIAAPHALGLRAFMIDHDRQREGIATAAIRALPDYLSRHYPDAPSVDLTVNHANEAAIACYLDGGFVDTGRDWLEGRAGPQDLLRLPLRRKPGMLGDLRSWRMLAKRFLVRVRQRVPPGLRFLLGLVLMIGGIFGFLPVLGLWMIPLGVAVAALDIVPLWRAIRHRLTR